MRLYLIICVCTLFWAILGCLIGAICRHPLAGLLWGLLFGIGYVLFGSWAAQKFPLDIWGASLLENQFAPNLYEMLEELSGKADIPLPIVYTVPVARPNAFVVAGRDGYAAVVVTNGLTRLLHKDEVQAVAALMIARLATGKMPLWTTAATLAGLPLHLGLVWRRRRGLEWAGSAVLVLFALPAVALLRLVWSERVVTAADDHAAHLAANPMILQAALLKMEAEWVSDAGSGAAESLAEVNPATALLFAVPPLAPSSAEAPLWSRQQSIFPSRLPDVAARAARFLSEKFSY